MNKKALICCLLVLAMCLAAFAACSVAVDNETLSEILADVERTERSNTQTPTSYELNAQVSTFDEKGNPVAVYIRWEIEDTALVTVSQRNADGKVTVTVPDQRDSGIEYKLRATLVDGKNKPITDSDGKEYSVVFSRVAPKSSADGSVTVTFNFNDGATDNQTVSVQAGASVTLPSPARANYTFDGWYDSIGGGTLAGNAGASYVVNASVTLYAHWTANQGGGQGDDPTPNNVTVTFAINYNGGTNPSAQTVAQGNSVILPGVSRTGYTLDGWYTESSGGTLVGKAGASYVANASVTLYAHWTANQQGGGGTTPGGGSQGGGGTTPGGGSGTQTAIPSGNGSQSSPYNAADAINAATALAQGEYSASAVYVKGYVLAGSTSQGSTPFKGSSGDWKMHLGNSPDSSENFYVTFATPVSGITDVKVGDLVVVYGYLENYYGATMYGGGSSDKPMPQLLSCESGSSSGGGGSQGGGGTTPGGGSGTQTAIPSGNGSQSSPYNAADAINAATALAQGEYSASAVYVKGYVLAGSTSQGSTPFKGSSGDWKMHLGNSPDSSENFYVTFATPVSGITDVKVGDLVVVYGYLENYYGATMYGGGSSDKPMPQLLSCESGSSSGGGSTGGGSTGGDVGGTSVTIDMATYATQNGWTVSTQGKVVSYTSLDCLCATVTVNATQHPQSTSGVLSGAWYGANWRLYGSENATLTFNAKSGYKITSVQITYTNGVLNNNGTNVTSGSVVTVNGSSLTLSVASGGQARITKIVIGYTQA